MAIDAPRFYEINGKQYPSVTTVLGIIRKPQLEQWRGRLGNDEADRVSQEATGLGKAVHQTIQRFNQGVKVRPKENIRLIIEAYIEWFNTTVEQVIAAEKVVWSDTYQFAGTCDLVVVLKGDKKPTVIDIKTSKSIYKDHALQLAAYRAALNEHETPAHRRLNLWLDKESPGKWRTKEWPNHDEDYRMFLYARSLWTYFEGGQARVSSCAS